VDALSFLTAMRDNVADVVFLDPPFNLGKDYGRANRVELYEPESYDLYMRSVLRHSIRVLRQGGALFVYQMPVWAIPWAAFLSEHLVFRNWIAVSMKNGFARARRLYPAHYALLYYTNGVPARFHRPKLEPRRCRLCDGLLKDYGGYRKIVEKKGINLSDVWDDLSPIRHKSTKLRAPNQLPLEITDRVCAIAGAPGSLLVDPFMGTGTSLVSALAHRMHFVGNDIEAANVRITKERLQRIKVVRRQP
jgi:site-specific DNA-methyltransferase (adenine-specific)